MKRSIVILSITLLVFTAATSCQQSKDKTEQTESTESNDQVAEVQYTCTMHPEVLEDEPGKCPKCGMELVKKEVAKAEETKSDSAGHEHQH